MSPIILCPPLPPCSELFGEASDFLKEGLEVTLNFHRDEAVTGEVPGQVRLQLGLRRAAAGSQGGWGPGAGASVI